MPVAFFKQIVQIKILTFFGNHLSRKDPRGVIFLRLRMEQQNCQVYGASDHYT
ncbi:MAG: hypothetical protein K0R82_2722 [Flavipsychrobacter sp.]|jgi:hypothetical protein|nr:hypothetical protein [Flavipsychrobacter sp.]